MTTEELETLMKWYRGFTPSAPDWFPAIDHVVGTLLALEIEGVKGATPIPRRDVKKYDVLLEAMKQIAREEVLTVPRATARTALSIIGEAWETET